MTSSGPWTSWGFNPWTTSLAFPTAATGFVFVPLAIQDWPSLTSFTPQLATSWSVAGHELTLQLQPDATWQDGKPVTSADVVDTVYLDGLTGAAVWSDITDIRAAGPHAVVLTAAPDIPMDLLKNDLFNGITPYPTHVWGRFATPAIKRDISSYFNKAHTDPGAAAGSTAYKNMSAALQELLKFSPKTLIGDGPYRLTGITTQEARLAKWNGFYDASHITIPQIRYLGNQQPQVNAALLTGGADFSSGWLYMPTPIVSEWSKRSDAHLLAVPGTFQGQIVFNDHQYPFTLTKVRQSLAYIIPRKTMDELSWGTEHPHAVTPTVPDGLVGEVEAQFLTKSQIASMNRYDYDPDKAAALLRSAGFHKSDGRWIMPNGHRFSVPLEINAGWTDQISAFKVASSALTSFGIDAPLSTVEGATYLADLHQGNFHVAAFCCTGGSPNPLLDFEQSPIGSANNFTAGGTNDGQRGIGFGPILKVPGIGKVNIPQELDSEIHRVAPGPKMKRLAYAWAKFVNTEVPYLEYADFANQIAFSSKKFTWPSTDSTLWSRISNGNHLVVVGQEKGLIHPK